MGFTVCPMMCALPIQDLWVCGRTTETVWPASWRERTREWTYGEDWFDGGPSSFTIWFRLVRRILEHHSCLSCLPECAFYPTLLDSKGFWELWLWMVTLGPRRVSMVYGGAVKKVRYSVREPKGPKDVMQDGLAPVTYLEHPFCNAKLWLKQFKSWDSLDFRDRIR